MYPIIDNETPDDDDDAAAAGRASVVDIQTMAPLAIGVTLNIFINKLAIKGVTSHFKRRFSVVLIDDAEGAYFATNCADPGRHVHDQLILIDESVIAVDLVHQIQARNCSIKKIIIIIFKISKSHLKKKISTFFFTSSIKKKKLYLKLVNHI